MSGVSARDVTERPPCECHGLPLSWNKRDDLPKGGYWQCKHRYKATALRWRERNRAHLKAANDRWREANRDRLPDLARQYRYGLPEGQYAILLAHQGGGCALCGVKPKNAAKGVLHLDHDHETGRIRGLLCLRCNSAMERLDQDGWLGRAIEYLDQER